MQIKHSFYGLLTSLLLLQSSNAMADHAAFIFITQKPLLQKIEAQHPELSLPALLSGVMAYDHLRAARYDAQGLLTIVDFSRPAIKKRLWVIDMSSGQVEFFTYVAQGINTGNNIAVHFSNHPGTHESSLGVYVTGNSYDGIAGHSLRLYGLDKGFNNNVFQRNIVMHALSSVSRQFIDEDGYLGHTDGCFGLNAAIALKIISRIENGTVMVAFYPNMRWLNHSPFEQPL